MAEEQTAASTSDLVGAADPATDARRPADAVAPDLTAAGSAEVQNGRRSGARSRALHGVVAVLALYALLRAIGVAVLLISARHVGVDFARVFDRFDMAAYARLAEHGYDQAIIDRPNGVPIPSNLAYFPLYPGLIRAVVEISPLPYIWAGLVVTWLSSLAAAAGLFAVGSQLYSRRVGALLVVFWAVLPYSIDESLGLTESLFTALAAWCIYALLKRRWLTAGLLCLVAGLSRPTAVALMAAVAVAAVIALYRRERPWWRPLIAVLISPLGWLAYIGWVGQRLHRPDGWFYVEDQTFRSPFDYGRYSWRMFVDTLTGHQATIEPYVVAAVLLIVAVLLVLSILDRQPLAMIVYSAVLVVTTVGEAGYYHAEPRHLLPAFPLLLPIAVGAARMRVRNLVAVVIVMTALSAWYGGWLATVWGLSY